MRILVFGMTSALIFSMVGCSGDTDSIFVSDQNKGLSYEQYVSGIDSLPDDRAGEIVRRAIEICGGWNTFTAKKAVSYKKTIRYIDSTGEVRREITQLHEYNMFPSYQVKLSWVDNGDAFEILNNGNQSWKLRNGQILTAQEEVNSAYNASFGAQYVMFMPFKLADPALSFEYLGVKELPGGETAEAVKVTYDTANSTTTDHDWTYYFDPESGMPIANFLAYPNGYSYTVYEAFTNADGLRINATRKSYQSDSTMTDLTLSTIYDNSQITFHDRYPLSMFEPEPDEAE